MRLISMPVWFITVDSSTALQCLKIAPRNLCPYSHLEDGLLSCSSIYGLLCLDLPFTQFLTTASVFILLCASTPDSVFFLHAASLWRGALSLLPSGLVQEAKQAQRPQQTAAPERQQGEQTGRDTHWGKAQRAFLAYVGPQQQGGLFTLHDNGYFEATLHVKNTVGDKDFLRYHTEIGTLCSSTDESGTTMERRKAH